MEDGVRDEFQQDVKVLSQTISAIESYFQGIQVHLENEAEGTAYIGPFRENPKRTYRGFRK